MWPKAVLRAARGVGGGHGNVACRRARPCMVSGTKERKGWKDNTLQAPALVPRNMPTARPPAMAPTSPCALPWVGHAAQPSPHTRAHSRPAAGPAHPPHTRGTHLFATSAASGGLKGTCRAIASVLRWPNQGSSLTNQVSTSMSLTPCSSSCCRREGSDAATNQSREARGRKAGLRPRARAGRRAAPIPAPSAAPLPTTPHSLPETSLPTVPSLGGLPSSLCIAIFSLHLYNTRTTHPSRITHPVCARLTR